MRSAILTDLHANREALEACLQHAEKQKVDRYFFLGDLVGYGADPAWVVETVMRYAQDGAQVLLGNHDQAVLEGYRKTMRAEVRQAITWTREQLSPAHLAFLQGLPLCIEEQHCHYAHANAWAPGQWEYITGAMEARRSLMAVKQRYLFAGHTHSPMLFHLMVTGKVGVFHPHADIAIPLLSQRRWLVIPGACGQPRDGNPAACYAIFDEQRSEITFHRVVYNYEASAEKIRKIGLSQNFAQRLSEGN